MSQSIEINQITITERYPQMSGDDEIPLDYIMDEPDETDAAQDINDRCKKILRKMPLSHLEIKPDIIMD